MSRRARSKFERGLLPPNAKLNVSIVIPAYNEESHLRGCLEAIARQTVAPLEVIVVDNNSTDATARVARSFPFVTVIQAVKQGVVHARDAGFNAARGEIIVRIDADTQVTADWVARLQAVFSDPAVGAVSGSVHYYDVAASRVIDPIDLRMRRWLAKHMGDTFLQGVNMGMRRTMWRDLRAALCRESGVHEDLDIAAHAGRQGFHVIFNPALRAHISARRIDTHPADFVRYVYLNAYTYKRHNIPERRFMYPIMAIVLLTYLPLRVLYRGFDAEHRRYSWRKLWQAKSSARVNPALIPASAEPKTLE